MMNRRTFNKLCGMGVAGLALDPRRFARGAELAAPAGTPLSSQVLTTDLGGTAWTLQQTGQQAGQQTGQQAGQIEKLPAQVPGDHYSDLLRAGKIPDPYYRDNNTAVQWAALTGWTYQRTFEATPQQLAMKHVELVCHGLDTFATVTLNGTVLGSTNNMFRTWVFDVQRTLKPGTNDLQIQFRPLPEPAEIKGWIQDYVRLHPGMGDGWGKAQPWRKWWSWIRKAPYQWSWDWCKPILTMGIWKGIELRAYGLRLANLAVVQHHNPDGSVRLDLTPEVSGTPPSGCQLTARLLEEGATVKQPIAPVGTATSLTLNVPQPKLWWPNGLGEQNLYIVEVQLVDAGENVLDTMRKRIGLRQFEAVMGTKELPFTMKVNGQPFFAKGADWVPPDNLLARITPERLRRFMQDAAACNFNFMRLWGGGFYEDDALFDACDELGIALLFEFKFANARYPSFDPQFIANVTAELTDQILRIRHHPAIAIWSGNNEIREFEGYMDLFDKVIGGKVRELVPGEFYQVSSGGYGAHDTHNWGLAHGKAPVTKYAASHGFVTEFGMQSALDPASTRTFATDADLAEGFDSPIFKFHECSSQAELQTEVLYYFGKLPAKMDDVFWLSQIVQAFGIRFGVEHWRRDRPHSTASLVWQYNDSWPGQTWSMIGYYHRWKALQYHARHMFAPVLVCGEVDAALEKAEIHVINDRLTGGKAMLSWRLATTDGKVLRHSETTIDLPANGNKIAETVVLSDAEKAAGLANLLLWMTVTPEGGSPETNLSLFALPGQLTLTKSPPIQTKVTGTGKQFSVKIESAKPALWTWINLANDPDARYSDNFVHLEPGTPVTINVTCGQEHSAEDFQDQLAVRSVSEFITPGIALPNVVPGSKAAPKPAPTAPTTGAGQ